MVLYTNCTSTTGSGRAAATAFSVATARVAKASYWARCSAATAQPAAPRSGMAARVATLPYRFGAAPLLEWTICGRGVRLSVSKGDCPRWGPKPSDVGGRRAGTSTPPTGTFTPPTGCMSLSCNRPYESQSRIDSPAPAGHVRVFEGACDEHGDCSRVRASLLRSRARV
jgi:hypothetical protein